MMIFQSFLLGNLVSFCMKIINSVVVVGLYYGFLTTFSIGPSYLLLLRAQVLEERSEKKVSATTGFISGQLIMFLSIYFPPLYLALGRPNTIAVLALSYFFFDLFNHKDFFDDGVTARNSMRNFSIQCVFLNNLIFPLFNHYFFPSAMLARVVNIYMFRCNNKMLFVTSSFVGWLIGHILVMKFLKWLVLGLVWIRQNPSIRLQFNKYIGSNVLINYKSTKYLLEKWRNSMARIFTILFFITSVYSLSRIPSPMKQKEIPKIEERDVEIETADQEDPSSSFFSEEGADPKKVDETEEIRVNENHDKSIIVQKKIPDPFFFEKNLATLLFDSNKWNRPFRYIKNEKFEQAVRNEMSQYFFDICESDGKKRICFTSPPSVSNFLEMLKRRLRSPEIWDLLDVFKLENYSSNELYSWVYTNKQKEKKEKNEFINRIKSLDKKSSFLNSLETRTRLCNDDSRKKYLPKRYDPFLNGSYRKTIYKNSILKKNWTKIFLEKFWINRIHKTLIPYTHDEQLELKMEIKREDPVFNEINKFKKNALLVESRINDSKNSLEKDKIYENSLERELELQRKLEQLHQKYLERDLEKLDFFTFKKLFDDDNSQNISKNRINEISKKIPRWEYKLITEFEQQTGEDLAVEDFEIRSREAKHVVLFTDTTNKDPDQLDEITVVRYLDQPDFDRDLIKGSVRGQRRKVVIWKVFQGNPHSPLFMYRIKKFILFSLTSNMFELIKSSFRNRVGKGEAFKIVESTNEQQENRREIEEIEEMKIREEDARMHIAEAWVNVHPYAQAMRGCLLLIQSIFRKYILLPSLIIAKNLGRIVLSQRPEWSEDFQEWNKEMHIICTYTGVPVGETQFPANWWIDGLQIKILFPFCLKPWHNSKFRSYPIETEKEKEDFCFLTVFGLEAKYPFGLPEKRPSFWKPVFKELGKKIKKNDFKEKTKILTKVSKENPTRLREVEIYELNEIQEEKDSKIGNQLINQSFNQIGSPDLTNSSLTEKKIKDLTERIGTIRNQIERITNKKRQDETSPNKTSYNAKSLEKWQILKRRNVRLISKFPLYFKLFIEIIYAKFLSGSFIPTRTKQQIELILWLTKRIIGKSLTLINKKKKTPIPFKKSLDNIRHSKTNLEIFLDLSYVSQAYVFFKLSQIQVSNLHKLRSVLQYQGISVFLKSEIKDSLEKQGMVHSKLKLGDKKLTNYELNQWKNWLRGYYPYDLSTIRWSRLIPEKWRNTVHQLDKKEKFRKSNSCETGQVSDSKKKIEVYKLANQKENFQKYSRYDLLAYKFLNSEKYPFYGFRFQGNKNRELSCNTHKDPLYDILKTSPIYNYGDILSVEKTANRKYFDWKIFLFSRRKKVDIESWMTIDANRNQNIQLGTLGTTNSISKKDICHLMLPEINPPKSPNVFVDWMGMNEKMLNHSISNLEVWFFPEFVLFHNAYKTKPWFIPNQLLLLNLNRNEKSSEKKKIKKKEKKGNQEEPTKREDFGSVLSQPKSSEENETRLDMKKKKKEKSNLDSFLERYLLFQLDWAGADEKLMNNIDVYCLLLRLKEPTDILISSIRRRRINLNLLMIQNSITHTELLNKGILIIEPIRLFGKNDGQFFMYQTISTSLVHKSKYQTNQKYPEERYVSRNHFDFLLPENLLSFRRRRKLRILISFNSKHRNDENRNLVFWNRKNSNQAELEQNLKLKLKLFLWPNYRLEDLACMNRYWFNTNNGSRFSMLRIHLYPRLKIHG
uniref:hypothetical protein RF1 n=1 Tax=Littorella uniflora TaxID=223169 RepID=UPI002238C809|nr:hypothetical protein RF1 [Littorella uniflora]QWL15663.1 hypothetical chloroplast RF19 [Littorella uniflora]UYG22602.1 hypothetical protein RF1 [Littorella uniflora]